MAQREGMRKVLFLLLVACRAPSPPAAVEPVRQTDHETNLGAIDSQFAGAMLGVSIAGVAVGSGGAFGKAVQAGAGKRGSGVAKADAYTVTMYLMAVLLAVGFVANWLMKPVDNRYYFKGEPQKA